MASKYSDMDDILKNNPLHNFASYNTLFTLSGINETQLRTSSYLTDQITEVIAQSGEIGSPLGATQFSGNDFLAEQKIAQEKLDDNLITGHPSNVLKRRQELEDLIKMYKLNASEYKNSVDILFRSHNVYIENVNILSTVGPNAERNLANFTKMDFEMHEPFGMTLIEKIRGCAYLNGYLDYQDAPFLLTIEFKGFDNNGKPIVGTNTDPLTGKHGQSGFLTRKIPVYIVNVEMDVNEGGSKYRCTAIPYTDMAHDNRFTQSRITVALDGLTGIGAWKIKVEKALNVDLMEQEVKDRTRTEGYEDKYIFSYHKDVVSQGSTYVSERESIHTSSASVADNIMAGEQIKNQLENDQNAVGGEDGEPQVWGGQIADAERGNPKKKSSASQQINANDNLVKMFEDAIRTTTGYQKLIENFWVSYLRGASNGGDSNASGVLDKLNTLEDGEATEYLNSLLNDKDKSKILGGIIADNQYINWFKIKTTVYTVNDKGLDPRTKMYPKIIHYRAEPFKIHVLKILGAGMSLGKIDWSEQVRRNYNYIYTGENIDVQNININYKSAFFQRNVREAKTITQKGIVNNFAEWIKDIIGDEVHPEPSKPIRQYPSIVKGFNSMDVDNPVTAKAQAFYDYLTNPIADMIKIEMEILGDPAYICQDMYTPLQFDDDKYDDVRKIYGETGEFNVMSSRFGSFNADVASPLINIRYRFPADIDDTTGNMFQYGKPNLEDDLFFSGVYQVVKVENRFNNGQFTQLLTCIRMNNQQGYGPAITLADAAKSDASKIRNKSDNKKADDQKAKDEDLEIGQGEAQEVTGS